MGVAAMPLAIDGKPWSRDPRPSECPPKGLNGTVRRCWRRLRTGVLPLALAVSACTTQEPLSPPPARQPPPVTSTATATAPQSPTTQTPPNLPKPPSDATFARAMFIHHVQVMELTDTLLEKRPVRRAVFDVAYDRKRPLAMRIRQLRGWLIERGEAPPNTTASKQTGRAGPGTITAADLVRLERASGRDAERVFLDLLARLNREAITMSRTQASQGGDPGLRWLATRIAADARQQLKQARLRAGR